MTNIASDVIRQVLASLLTEVARHGAPTVALPVDKFKEGVRALGLDGYDLEALRAVAAAAAPLVGSGNGPVALDLLQEGIGRSDGGKLFLMVLGLVGNRPAAGA